MAAEPARASDLKYGHGTPLWNYWTKGAGFAKWSSAVHKWTTLRDLLLAEGVPPGQADGLATNIIMAVMPGYMKLAHKKGRSAGMDDDQGRAGSPKPYGDVKYADPKNGKYPIDTAAHAKAALSYISMPKNAQMYPMNGVTLAEVKARIIAACRKFGIEVAEAKASEPGPDECIRAVPFEVTSTGDGLTLEGYAAVFNRTATIHDRLGEFEEQIAPGAFRDALAARTPVLMFEHGKHPLIGSMPLGRIDDAYEDERGLFISARLSDNWLIQPVRDAVRDGAVTGMSFRFTSPADEDQVWEKRDGKPDLRTLLRIPGVPELGPVVFPAYEPTTASVRSVLDALDAGDTLEDFTSAEPARSEPAGEQDVEPGNGRTSYQPSKAALERDRAWRMRGIR